MSEGQIVTLYKTLTPKGLQALLVIEAATTPESGQVDVDGRSGSALVCRGLVSEVFGLKSLRHVYCSIAYRITERGQRLVKMFRSY